MVIVTAIAIVMLVVRVIVKVMVIVIVIALILNIVMMLAMKLVMVMIMVLASRYLCMAQANNAGFFIGMVMVGIGSIDERHLALLIPYCLTSC